MKLNELFGTEFPLIQGGMASIATGEFAAAVSNAGALGLVGAGGMNAAQLRDHIRRCKELTDRPFGVNLMLMNPEVEEQAKIVVEEGVGVVTTGAGVPGKYIPMWKEAGIKIFPVVAAGALVKRLAPLGVDGFIAEGTESGGHVGEMTTMALVPQIRALTAPVLAVAVPAPTRVSPTTAVGNPAMAAVPPLTAVTANPDTAIAPPIAMPPPPASIMPLPKTIAALSTLRRALL